MIDRPRPLYGLRAAMLSVVLLSASSALLIWMLSATIGPFDFLVPSPHPEGSDAFGHVEVRGASGSGAPVDAQIERVGPKRLLLQVTNPAAVDAVGVVLRVHLHGPTRLEAVRGTRLLDDVPHWKKVGGDGDFELWLPVLPAGVHRAWTLDLGSGDGA